MSSVRAFFAGDFCSKPSASKIRVSDELKDLIESCDLKVVNFEVPLKPEMKMVSQKRERFYQNDDTPFFLRSLGFNCFSLANNHAFDWGTEGFLKTKAALGDAAFGAGNYEEAYKVKVVEVNGMRIGLMGLSFAAYTGVFDDVNRHDGLGCAYINDLRVNHDIMRAKNDVDFLFVLPHDGIEYVGIPMPETIARYHDFIEYGADAVIAAHPHCPQGWEEYKGKPIFYSLGNFLFNSKENYDFRAKKPHWYEGLCVVMDIGEDRLTWEIVNTRNVGNLGIEIDSSEDRNKHNEQLCRCLTDKEDYNIRLQKIIGRLGRINEMKVIEKSVLNHWLNRIRRKEFINDDELAFLIKNDQRRSLLIRSLSNEY